MRCLGLLHLIVLSLLCNICSPSLAQENSSAGEQDFAKAAARKKQKNYPAEIEGAEVRVYKSINDVELNAYIFSPEDKTQPVPAIVFFFGGGWTAGSPTQFEQHCKYFASRGMVAITADYRVASRHAVKAVDCVADAKSAIRWVRTHAEALGVDPDRIVAAGGSAGGHIAAATGTLVNFDEANEAASVSSRPNALALFNPALVLAKVDGKTFPDDAKLSELAKRLGVAPEELSPYHQIASGVPPTIIFHGKADTTVPYWTAETFHAAMLEHGNQCKLVGFENAQHGFFNFGRDGGEHYQACIKALDEFLVSLDFLKASTR